MKSINESEGKKALDKVISKSRVHLYKPIQIAEILYRDRVYGDIKIEDLETYRNQSKQWRDEICKKLVGRVSTSSQKFQDDLFNKNAIPPNLILELSEENKKNNGIIESYIYNKFKEKFTDLSEALSYCEISNNSTFDLNTFLSKFTSSPGLKRSIDKIYEITVYSLFSSLIEEMDISIELKVNNPDNLIFQDFQDFTQKILGINSINQINECPAKLFRVGITNAADRGLDMWANFGLAIQIKHISLTEEIAESVSQSIQADRIIIVCKDVEEKIIMTIINKLGIKSQIQSIITLSELNSWYEKCMNNKHKNIGNKIIQTLKKQIILEFPSSNITHINDFLISRSYEVRNDDIEIPTNKH